MTITTADTDLIPNKMEEIYQSIGKEMFGYEEVIKLCLVAFYMNGHILLEGNPGLGKTALVKALSKELGLPFGRIQFTPDLMPSEITGTEMPLYTNGQISGEFKFKNGPIFWNLLLADEINRATPKTQSAMLEAMAESQVTVLGKKYKLPKPFMVLATQNPIEQQGTYELPEAQADRFMFKIFVPIPDAKTIRQIMKKETKIPTNEEDQNKSEPLFQENADYVKIRTDILNFPLGDDVEEHIVNICMATNRQSSQSISLDERRKTDLEKYADEFFEYGLSPRAAIALMKGAKAWSRLFIPGATQAVGTALAHVALPALRHRLHLKFDWVEKYQKIKPELRNLTLRDLHNHFLLDFVQMTIPNGNSGYDKVTKAEIFKLIRNTV